MAKVLTDDEPLARAGISSLLAQAEDIEIVGEVQGGFEVKEVIPKLHPQILLLDLKMPGPGPYEIEKWVRENYPETITLVLTSHDRDAYLATLIDTGVAGYLSKEEPAERLIGAIRRAAELPRLLLNSHGAHREWMATPRVVLVLIPLVHTVYVLQPRNCIWMALLKEEQGRFAHPKLVVVQSLLQRVKLYSVYLATLGEWTHPMHLQNQDGVAGFRTYQRQQIYN